MLQNHTMNKPENTDTHSYHNKPLNYSRFNKQIDAHKQRVTQTNMVYLIGLPEEIADQEVLESYQYCGQYGQIIKTMVKKNYFNDFASYSAYITYTTDEAASIAILGINNLLFGKARIYASYGTNKYCATFIKFGKCRKVDCPFFHRLQPAKEIRQDDNKKLFQDQQLLAKSYVMKNYLSMNIQDQGNSNSFPSRYEVIQSLIEEGSIKPKKQSKSKPIMEVIQRSNALKDNVFARSEISTECSPTKTFDSEQQEAQEPDIIPKIARKLKHSGKSILGFHKGEHKTVQKMTSLILSVLVGKC